MNKLDLLQWLQSWYSKQCDGDWEHGNGLKISTIDNPGWRITISLNQTELASQPFHDITIERTENDWVHCFVKNGFFESACGPNNLSEALEIFKKWTVSIE